MGSKKGEAALRASDDTEFDGDVGQGGRVTDSSWFDQDFLRGSPESPMICALVS